MCYKDKTFCEYKDCYKFSSCDRALTEQVRKEADEAKNNWVSVFAEKPDCFEKLDGT